MGAWIEIKVEYLVVETRGQSHPTMGAWIEILACLSVSDCTLCRTPRWVRGLKFYKRYF